MSRTLTYSTFQFRQALAGLDHYYGITLDYFPVPLRELFTGPDAASHQVRIQPGWDPDWYDGELSRLGIGENRQQIASMLNLLTYLLRTNPSMMEGNASAEMLRAMVRRDCLRLYLFLQSLKPGDEVTLRDRRQTVSLSNYGNWLVEEVLSPCLRETIPDVQTPAQARQELDSRRPHKGRRANDARVPILMWGTFTMLSDAHAFATPMPNSLCEFIIGMLHRQQVIADPGDVDVLWIRAQLRYIRTRETKPRFPIAP